MKFQRWFMLCVLSLVACATTPPAAPPALPLLKPQSLGRTVYAQQQLEAEFQGQSWQMQGALEVTPTQMRLVGLTPYGQRVITLLWDGEQLQEERDARLPESVQGTRILSDLQLIYWPLPALQAILPADWRVTQQGKERQFLVAGQVVINIVCTAEDAWAGRCVFDHVRDGYRLTLDSQLNAP